MRPDELFNLCLISIPLWIPAVIGLYLVANRRNKLSLMAGLLTLKPILTTPLWIAIFNFLQSQGVAEGLIALVSILPGASLTALSLLVFRRLLSGSTSTSARLLIRLDCIRWMNSGLLLATVPLESALLCIFAVLGLIFPTAYAVVALRTTLATDEG